MKQRIPISGMHCPSCKLLVERRLKKIKGVKSVEVDVTEEIAQIKSKKEISKKQINTALQGTEYAVGKGRNKYAEIGASAIIILAMYVLLKFFNVLPETFSVSDNMSYVFIFVLGLVASVSSCLAVSGGLLLAISTKYNKANPNLSRWERFLPHLYFNGGRLISYILLGAFIGALGGIISLTPGLSGYLTIVAALVMIGMGVQMIGLFPTFSLIPTSWAEKIYSAEEEGSTTQTKAFLFGGATFFLPCGFTQALQLYVLSTASVEQGAIVMGLFALGTMPSLLGIGALTTVLQGKAQRIFTTTAALLVIGLGALALPSGLSLAGFTGLAISDTSSETTIAETVGNVQEIHMKVVGLDYYPHKFQVKVGEPVRWVIDGRRAQGCAIMFQVPKLNILDRLKSETIYEFTPTEVGKIPFHCSMAMTTPGAHIEVIA